MASNVVVQIDNLNKQTVKTTPMMSLKTVLNTVCEKNGLDPECYGLKHKKDMLDLSLSLRFANLVPGAKLDLLKIEKREAASVNVALQLEEGGRLVGQFSADASFWSILLAFEERSSGKLNLTKRTGKPSSAKVFSLKNVIKRIESIGKNENVYFQPILVVMAKEYSTIPVLQETTLKSLGFNSGNLSIRVLFKETDVTLQDVLPLMENKSAAVQVEKAVSSKPEKKAKIESAPAQTVSVTNTAEPVTTDETLHQDSASFSFDRKVRVFKQAETSSAKIVLPDSFFQLTGPELKYALMVSEKRRKEEIDRPLMTKAMRDRQEEERSKKFPKTMIRIRFYDLIHLQGEFLTEEKIQSLYDFVNNHLKNDVKFVLYTTPPMRKLENELLQENFYKAGLAPSSVVYIQLLGTSEKLGGQDVLNEETLSKLGVIDHPSLNKWIPEIETTEMQIDENKNGQTEDHKAHEKHENKAGSSNETPSNSNSPSGSRKVPKWFKMQLKK